MFYFVFEGNFQVQAPQGAYHLEGRFNGGFFALRVWGAYIWRDLYMEGLILGILRYVKKTPKLLGLLSPQGLNLTLNFTRLNEISDLVL